MHFKYFWKIRNKTAPVLNSRSVRKYVRVEIQRHATVISTYSWLVFVTENTNFSLWLLMSESFNGYSVTSSIALKEDTQLWVAGEPFILTPSLAIVSHSRENLCPLRHSTALQLASTPSYLGLWWEGTLSLAQVVTQAAACSSEAESSKKVKLVNTASGQIIGFFGGGGCVSLVRFQIGLQLPRFGCWGGN